MASFVPVGGTFRLTATTSAQYLEVPKGGYQYIAWTRGANPVFLKFSNATAQASAVAVTYASTGSNGTCVPPGAVMDVTKVDANWMSYITDTSTSVFYVQFGNGE